MKTKVVGKKTGAKAKNPKASATPAKAGARQQTAGKAGSGAVAKRASVARTRPARSRTRQAAPAGRAPIYYRLHALLHTVQVIARFEDSLAALLHEAAHAGELDADAREELHTLLLDMPSSSYHAELDALHEALHALREREAA